MQYAPDFSLPDQDGITHSLDDYRGHWIVLYFYPKDNSPGCVMEACELRDEHDIISQFGNASIIGISKDSVRSHKKFASEHHLNFPLLSDVDHGVLEAYGAWKSKRFMGKSYMGVERTTVIVNPKGLIIKTYKNVIPKGHAAEIIQDLQHLQTSLVDVHSSAE